MIDMYTLCMDLQNSQSDLRRKSNHIVSDIYNILNNPTEKTQKIIDGWKEDFSYIYGDVEAGSETAAGQVQLLFYAVQTYFSILIKCVMREILAEDFDKKNYEGILLGDFALSRGIKNYCYPDWYCWPVFELENGFARILDEIIISVENCKCVMSIEEFARNNNYDYIKQMYEAVIPKELRHALGEYYTPDWLAEETLKTAIGFDGQPESKHFMDPTCGSGTFIFKAIIEKRKAGCSLTDIISSVSGADINPLAVLTAKTNYLLAVIDLIDGKTEIEIPVYNADIVKLDETPESEEVLDFLTCENPCSEIYKYINLDRRKILLQKKADIIMGNPPWVNWEYMPEKYRTSSQHLWVDYLLFAAKGRDLSFSKEDISVLITYIVIDKLLKDKGILAFVIRQGVFKSAQNGTGFRRFRLKDEYGIKVLRVDDLSKIRAFDNAANSTAILYIRKGEETEYPVHYVLWEKREDLEKLSFNAYSELGEVKSQTVTVNQMAIPAVKEDTTSLWLTAAENELNAMTKVLGTNSYRARTGVFTGGANAVYWMNVTGKIGDKIQVTNIVERAKRKTKKVTAEIEDTYVFPMLRGSNVKKWNVTYDTYLLCPHTKETRMRPVSQEILKTEVPETYNYLLQFKEDLDGRRGFAGWEKEIQQQEFHAILRIGDYTFSNYKVIWKYIASEFICAVIGYVEDKYLGNKMLLPNEKIMYVSTDDEDEAYYLCGILSSTPVAACVKSYMNPTSISAHVLNKLNIPEFDKNNSDHLAISDACRAGHREKNISHYIDEIDRIANRIYFSEI